MGEKDIPRLDVSITDSTLEEWSWTKVEDAYPHPEHGNFFMFEIVWSLTPTVWDKLYGPKMKRDLEMHATTSADAKKKKVGGPIGL